MKSNILEYHSIYDPLIAEMKSNILEYHSIYDPLAEMK
jgi:hypothetical protein